MNTLKFIGEYLEVEKGPLQVGFLSLFLAYIVVKHFHIRKTIRKNSQDVFVLKKNNWVLAIITWGVLAAMLLNNLSGVYFIINAFLVVGVMIMVAISESTDEYLINQEGITNLKTSNRIDIDSISRIEMSSNILGIHYNKNREELLIEGDRLKSNSLSQMVDAIEKRKKNRI